ncbi:MAG: hypothetical protein HY459_01535 [Parcubacteria group bacterium]|nr:hypothetical protein [Parcubacteria group bacterium]
MRKHLSAALVKMLILSDWCRKVCVRFTLSKSSKRVIVHRSLLTRPRYRASLARRIGEEITALLVELFDLHAEVIHVSVEPHTMKITIREVKSVWLGIKSTVERLLCKYFAVPALTVRVKFA